MSMTVSDLVNFEKEIAALFKAGKVKCPIHLASGNEAQLIELFKGISRQDWVFSTHRNHLHYLLHTDDAKGLKRRILDRDSMHTCSPKHHFYSSAIVSGCVAIACGVAWALKREKSKQKVWVFLGDGGFDEGWTYEAWRYVVAQDLPLCFVIEDNDRSCVATRTGRWGPYDSGFITKE